MSRDEKSPFGYTVKNASLKMTVKYVREKEVAFEIEEIDILINLLNGVADPRLTTDVFRRLNGKLRSIKGIFNSDVR